MHLSSEGQIPCIPVVIPYFRASTALQRCLKAIESQIGVTTKIYVRDNSEDNILFTKAVNEGLRKFAYENNSTHFILVLRTRTCVLKACKIWWAQWRATQKQGL